jgi:deoxyribodipyrimidine photo-lyase
MNIRRSIVWFRQDLRLHDNEALTDAINICDEIIPVYVFDERLFHNKSKYGFPKIGIHRARLMIESVLDLKSSLQAKGSDLYVRIGKPEEIIFELASELKTSWVYCNRERTREELEVQNELEKKLWTIGQEILFYRGKMLLYTSDLPFPVTHTPDVFTQFRKEIENFVPVREPIEPIADKITAISAKIDFGEVPELKDLGFEEVKTDPRSAFPFKGGETEALKRLQHYVWESKAVKTYKDTRNELLGADYSTKFSPYLAIGCLSPKKIHHEVKQFEEKFGANESTYWVTFELLWRDFFRLMAKKYVNKIFLKGGTLGRVRKDLSDDIELFTKWAEGKTGIPFIDANMRELVLTGFMSNRGRQNVASFLVNDLKVNWQLGAEWFEANLIDYDPSSNWGNWNYVAGVGNDPRQDRVFNILSQAKRYDPDGAYVKTWLPELESVPESFIHNPEAYAESKGFQSLSEMGIDYPEPIVQLRVY